ncbi:MAG: hypothetical protein Q7S09_03690 [bacterium]|nr:hypothetical protein [bacterium]
MNEFLLKRVRFSLLLVLTTLAVGLLLITPDLITWWRIDRFQTPLRNLGYDQIHYLTNLHRLQVEGMSGSSMFTWEHRVGLPRFPFFDLFIQHLPYFASLPIIWWQIILKFFSALAVFLGLYGLFRAGRVKMELAFLLALVATLLYSPYTNQDVGLTTWFLIFFLLGINAFVFAVVRHPYSLATLGASIFFLFLSMTHPVFLFTAIGTTGLWWLGALWQKRKDWRVWLYGCIWLGAVGVSTWLLLGDYIKVFLGHSASAANDGFFERNGGVRIRVPLFPLLVAQFGFLTAALYVGYRKYRRSLDAGGASVWLVLSFLAFQGFLFNIQNIVTGFSVIADHFSVLAEFVALPAAAMILFAPSEVGTVNGEVVPVYQNGSGKGQKTIGIGLLAVTAILIASLTLDRPIRSWLVLGHWAPLISSYFIIGLWLLSPEWLARAAVKAARFLPLVLVPILSVVYAGLLLWRFSVYDLPAQKDFQANRQIFSRLSKLPAGVVMAPPGMSEYIALYTPQRVYWTFANGQFGGTYQEFAGRLVDERLIFENNSELGGDIGHFSIFGAPDQWCPKLTEKLFYTKMRQAGIANVTTCIPAKNDADWPKYLAEYARRRDEIAHGAAWTSAYRLDWLVVDESEDRVSRDMIGRYFEKVESVGDFTIYRYRNSVL